MTTNLPDKAFTPNYVLGVAANLVSESGENPEYDRALCELVADLGALPREAYEDGMETARPYALQELRRRAGIEQKDLVKRA